MLGEEVLHLTIGGESAGLSLGEDRLAIEMDLEDTIAALDELGLEPETFLDAVRQTGGTGTVVSNPAVFDRY